MLHSIRIQYCNFGMSLPIKIHRQKTISFFPKTSFVGAVSPPVAIYLNFSQLNFLYALHCGTIWCINNTVSISFNNELHFFMFTLWNAYMLKTCLLLKCRTGLGHSECIFPQTGWKHIEDQKLVEKKPTRKLSREICLGVKSWDLPPSLSNFSCTLSTISKTTITKLYFTTLNPFKWC